MPANRILAIGALTALSFMLSSFPAAAQSKPAPQPTPAVVIRAEDGNGANNTNNGEVSPLPIEISETYLSSPEFYLAVLVALIGLIAFVMQFLLLRRIRNLKAEDMLRVFSVTLVLIGTLFFVTAGFGAQQIAPAMGLFGTVAGYLLGRSVRDENLSLEGGKSENGKEK